MKKLNTFIDLISQLKESESLGKMVECLRFRSIKQVRSTKNGIGGSLKSHQLALYA